MADDDLAWDAEEYVAPDLKLTNEFGEEIVKKVDEDEEKKAAEAAAAAQAASQQKQAKEKAKKQQQKANLEKLAEEAKVLTPQELEERQRNSDLALAREAFGIQESSSSAGSIDSFEPKSKEDFDQLVRLISAKLATFEKNEHYHEFLSALFTDLCVKLDSEQIRHYARNLSSLGEQRHKDEKEREKAKQPKSKKKAALVPKKAGGDLEDIITADSQGYNDYDDDDFM